MYQFGRSKWKIKNFDESNNQGILRDDFHRKSEKMPKFILGLMNEIGFERVLVRVIQLWGDLGWLYRFV